mgnify:FL=1
MNINDKVRMVRELRDWSQEEMAQKLGMSTNGYAKIERGEVRLNIPKLEQIAAVFGMNLLDLMAISDKSIVYLVNENSIHSSNYYAAPQDLVQELEKTKLMLAHKDELLAQQASEIKSLKMLVEILQAKISSTSD